MQAGVNSKCIEVYELAHRAADPSSVCAETVGSTAWCPSHLHIFSGS